MSAALDASVPNAASGLSARSALAARSPSLRAASGRSRARALRLVPQARSKAARTPFVVVLVALLGGGLLGLLALNTVLAQDAFRLHALKTQGRELAVREQALQREVESLRTPQALAARAQEMGMVPAGPPAFLRLSDGAVIGVPEPGLAPIDPGRPGQAAPSAPERASDDGPTADADGDAGAASSRDDQ
jgi:cell division protein FtsB